MRKFDRRPFSFPGLSTKEHWLLGVVWPVIGSKGDRYEVELVSGGFKCTCMAFSIRGQCKHIQGVWDRLGRAVKMESLYDGSW